MLVFWDAGLVLLATPKTGTHALEAALGDVADMAFRHPPRFKHMKLTWAVTTLHRLIESPEWERFRTVAVMREPLDWLGSWYRYRQRPGQEQARNSTHGISFDDFVTEYMKGKRAAFAQVGSQTKFLEPQNNGTAVTHLFRYEDQDGLRRFLSNRLEIEIETRRMNSSPAMALALDPDVEQRYRRKFAVEYQLYDGIAEDGAFTPLPNGVLPPHH